MGATLVEKIEGRLAGPLSHDPWGFLASFLDIFGFPKATFERLRIKRDPEGYSYAEVTNKNAWNLAMSYFSKPGEIDSDGWGECILWYQDEVVAEVASELEKLAESER